MGLKTESTIPGSFGFLYKVLTVEVYLSLNLISSLKKIILVLELVFFSGINEFGYSY